MSNCTTDTGEKIIVEMQNSSQSFFKERALYYLSKAVVGQGQRGDAWKFDIKAVYGVFLMNFLIDSNIKLRTDVVLADRETKEVFSDKFRLFVPLNGALFSLRRKIIFPQEEFGIPSRGKFNSLKRDFLCLLASIPFRRKCAVFGC